MIKINLIETNLRFGQSLRKEGIEELINSFYFDSNNLIVYAVNWMKLYEQSKKLIFLMKIN